MENADRIIQYLLETYHPDAIITYGSYADGSANMNSDFDALVIADCLRKHDSSIIENTVLDVFVYPPEVFQTDFDPEEFVQVFDGKIILDRSGTAKRLKACVLDYIERQAPKTEDEIRQALDWCDKMVSRTAARGDAEGYYRWHWLLIDSLEIYYDVIGRHYYGPKKALRSMADADPEGFEIYSRALKHFDRSSLSEWIAYLKRLSPVQ